VVGVGLDTTVSEFNTRAIELDPETHLYLQDHRLSGKPVVPMAMIVEWFASAGQRAAGEGSVTRVRDLQLFQGIVLDDGPAGAGVLLNPRLDGSFDAEFHDASGRVCARAVVETGTQEGPPPARSSEALASYPHSVEEVYARKLFHGERLHAIEEVEGISDTSLSTTLKVAPAPSEWILGQEGGWVTDPLVIDGCFQSMILWCWENRGAPSLPSRLDSYVQYRESWPRDGVRARFFVRPASGPNVVADIDILDLQGTLVARMEGYGCTVSASLTTAFGLGDHDPAAVAVPTKGSGRAQA
ncbi:MAG: polyketide synthase dehydratase domain-containing protein, partial [Myxococcota bacterium]|nr:polyketide synthase dehydratase domain-containing protein [Myxococcota bacterium]